MRKLKNRGLALGRLGWCRQAPPSPSWTLEALLHAGDEAFTELVHSNFNSLTNSILILYKYGGPLVQRQQWVSDMCIIGELDLTIYSYIEGIVRGYRNGLLTQTNYTNLTQCETIDGIPKCILHLVVG